MSTAICSQELESCLPALNRFALKLTRNEDRAVDLVQDTIERALRKSHLFDGSKLRSWLFTICRRVFLNQIRRDRIRGQSVCMDDAPQGALATSAEQEIKLHFREVAETFEALPERDRTILSQVVLEGKKYEEVAAHLEVPIGTVRSRLSRARKRLAKQVA